MARALPVLALAVVAGLVAPIPKPARGFGDTGAFDPRVLLAGGVKGAARPSAPARWSWELVASIAASASFERWSF